MRSVIAKILRSSDPRFSVNHDIFKLFTKLVFFNHRETVPVVKVAHFC